MFSMSLTRVQIAIHSGIGNPVGSIVPRITRLWVMIAYCVLHFRRESLIDCFFSNADVGDCNQEAVKR